MNLLTIINVDIAGNRAGELERWASLFSKIVPSRIVKILQDMSRKLMSCS